MVRTSSAPSTWPLRALKVREHASVEGVLDLLGHPPQPDGQLSCPSPTHPDRHPSARVYADTRKVHCFGCGSTWDVIGLVQTVQGVSFSEAIAFLEQAFDITDATDAGLVRSVLARAPAGNHAGLMDAVRDTLLRARTRMSLPQYARLWRAYDTTRHGFAARTLDEDTFVAAMERIAGLVPPPDAPEIDA